MELSLNMHSLEQDRYASLVIGSLIPDHATQRAFKHQCLFGLCSRMQQAYDEPILDCAPPCYSMIGGSESSLIRYSASLRLSKQAIDL